MVGFKNKRGVGDMTKKQAVLHIVLIVIGFLMVVSLDYAFIRLSGKMIHSGWLEIVYCIVMLRVYMNWGNKK